MEGEQVVKEENAAPSLPDETNDAAGKSSSSPDAIIGIKKSWIVEILVRIFFCTKSFKY